MLHQVKESPGSILFFNFRYRRTDKSKDKLLIYLVIVALILNNFVLDVGQLALDMKLTVASLSQKIKETGARITSKKLEGKTVKTAQLVLPLQFPQRSKGAQ